jgi:RNA polymerase sigma-70 factor (ECF subfamily)
MTEYTDKDIIKLIEDGNSEKGMRILVDIYHIKIYNHIRHILISHEDTNDVTQEVFIKIWQNIGKFRGESKLFSWIYRIATNEAVNFLRKNRKHKILVRESTENYLANLLESDSEINGDKLQIDLQKAVLKLPEQQRLIFNMRYFEEIKFKDIASILKLSEGGVKSSYHVAEKKIRQFFKTD